MSNAAPSNTLRVDPRAFDQDYEYKRPVSYNLWQPGFILGAEVHKKRGGSSLSLKLVIGVMSTEPNQHGKRCGAKIDTYIPLAGDKYRDVVAVGDPESPARYDAAYKSAKAQGISEEKAVAAALRAAETNLDKWAGKPCMVIMSEEDDKMQTERTGIASKRARVDQIARPAAPAAAPAPAPVAGTSLI